MIFYIRQSFITRYLIIWIAYTSIYALSIYFVLPVNFKILLIDSAIHSLLLSILGSFVWGIIRHSNYDNLNYSQRIISYIILPVFTLTAWIFIGYTADIIFIGEAYARAIAYTIPIRALTGTLMSVIMVAYSKYLRVEQERKEEERKEEMRIFGSDAYKSGEVNSRIEMDDGCETSELEKAEVKKNPGNIQVIERISVKNGSKIVIVPISDIIYIRSYGDYVNLITENGKFVKEQTMKYFETNLPRSLFVRIHRSYIVNISKISGIELYAKHIQQIVLANGERLKISAAGYKILRKTLSI